MGNALSTLSSCCKGTVSLASSSEPARSGVLTAFSPGRPKDNLYEPALADSEREAVADLLQYLENVCPLPPHTLTQVLITAARRDRFLFGRTSTSLMYSCLFRQCRPATKRQSHVCRNHRARYAVYKTEKDTYNLTGIQT